MKESRKQKIANPNPTPVGRKFSVFEYSNGAAPAQIVINKQKRIAKLSRKAQLAFEKQIGQQSQQQSGQSQQFMQQFGLFRPRLMSVYFARTAL
jgi:hypothetical protein